MLFLGINKFEKYYETPLNRATLLGSLFEDVLIKSNIILVTCSRTGCDAAKMTMKIRELDHICRGRNKIWANNKRITLYVAIITDSNNTQHLQQRFFATFQFYSIKYFIWSIFASKYAWTYWCCNLAFRFEFNLVRGKWWWWVLCFFFHFNHAVSALTCAKWNHRIWKKVVIINKNILNIYLWCIIIPLCDARAFSITTDV